MAVGPADPLAAAAPVAAATVKAEGLKARAGSMSSATATEASHEPGDHKPAAGEATSGARKHPRDPSHEADGQHVNGRPASGHGVKREEEGGGEDASPSGGEGDEDDGSPGGKGSAEGRRKRSRKGLDKKYTCPQEGCGKSYSRAEHLYRHQLNREPVPAHSVPAAIVGLSASGLQT